MLSSGDQQFQIFLVVATVINVDFVSVFFLQRGGGGGNPRGQTIFKRGMCQFSPGSLPLHLNIHFLSFWIRFGLMKVL